MDIRPPKRPSLQLPAPPTEPLLPEPPPQQLLLAKNEPRWLRPRTIVWAVLVVLILCGLALVWWCSYSLSPVDTANTARTKVTIATGMNVNQIASLLQRQGLIRNQVIFRLYTEVTHTKDHLQAGVYRLSPSESTQRIVSDLVAGKVEAFDITISPGLRLDQIKQQLQKAGFEAADIDKAYRVPYDTSLFASKPDGTTLEGYIFPDTYKIDGSSTVQSLLTRTFDQFEAKLSKSDVPRLLTDQGLTLYQAVTLASIIEKETSNEAEQKQVAQVLLLRLKIGKPLQSDTTFIYAAQLLHISPPTSSIDSPYNTYKYPGLPPGPIANFNFAALDAVVHPATGDYLYFVAGDDGVMHFSHTIEEHDKNVSLYCHKLCTQQ